MSPYISCCIQVDDSKGKSVMFDQTAPEAMRYLQRVVDEILAVLFDSRRQSCHGLVLNNFVSCSGFKQLLAKFQLACQCLFDSVDKQEAHPEADSAAAKTNGEAHHCLTELRLAVLGSNCPLKKGYEDLYKQEILNVLSLVPWPCPLSLEKKMLWLCLS